MSTCRWRGCTTKPRHRGVCERHRDRTFAAGRRSAWGTPAAVVLETIAHYEHLDAEYQRRASMSPPKTRLEDLEWLLDQGEWPERAAHRCGWKRDSAIAAAHRAGRPDLAELLTLERVDT